jgi:hypothetical protein
MYVESKVVIFNGWIHLTKTPRKCKFSEMTETLTLEDIRSAHFVNHCNNKCIFNLEKKNTS